MRKLSINNIKDLEEALKTKPERIGYAQLLNSIHFNFKEIEPLCFWDADNYSKINIGNGINYELALICWESKQQSNIHKHPEIKTFTYVLKGELTEEVFVKSATNTELNQTVVIKRKKTASFSCENNIEHRLTNSYTGRTVSLHLYVKSIVN